MPGGHGVDPEIAQLAAGSANFGYLLAHEPLLVSLGAATESYVHSDANAAMFKARLFGEVLAQHMVARMGVQVTGTTQFARVQALKDQVPLRPEVFGWFDTLRAVGNRAAHEHYGEVRAALRASEVCFLLGDWLHRSTTSDATHRVFLPPAAPQQAPAPASAADEAELASLRAELEAYRNKLAEARLRYDGKLDRLQREQQARQEAEAELERADAERQSLHGLVSQLSEKITRLAQDPDRVQATAADPIERDRIVARAQSASRPPLNEAQVRVEIDRALVLAGWAVQDLDDMDVVNHRGAAVREVTTRAGRADYLLYVDARLVGVIEAKREGADLSGAQEQAARYASHLTSDQRISAGGWERLPFQYVSDGNTVRFRNELDPDARSRRVFSVHRPETMARWIHEAATDPDNPTFRARLRLLPETYLDIAPLREAQVEAIVGLEKSLACGDTRALVQMTMGAGKTHAVVQHSYRVLKHAKAQRVLFLVDRNNLGKQAVEEYEGTAVPGGSQCFSDVYPVQRLLGGPLKGSSDVVVSTIQRLWLSLTGQPVPESGENQDDRVDTYDVERPVEVSYNKDLPPETFDVIYVDECHRSIYGKWRGVLDYFDAHIIGLTATPVPQTYGFFHQNLVSEYPSERAVADKVNVPFTVFRIRTELGEHGGLIPAETVVPIRERKTRRERYKALDADFSWKAPQLGRDVISKGSLKLVIETFKHHLFSEIFLPIGEDGAPARARATVPKTLIFAADENHAEEIVETVRQVFGKGDGFCAKITHTVKQPDKLLQRFRRDPDLRIAVTVDMIATGTDVRPLECVFFLRNVRSWAYFEQMKGRGARTIDPAEFQAVTPDAKVKDRFVIVDAVGVTDSPRVDAQPMERKSERQLPLERLLRKSASLVMSEEEVATLAARLNRLDMRLTNEERTQVAHLAGKPLGEVVGGLLQAIDTDTQEAADAQGGEAAVRKLVADALRPLAGSAALRKLIIGLCSAHIVYDEVNPDQLIEARGMTEEEIATQTVASWREYLHKNRDVAAAFQIAFTERKNPREVHRQLRALAQSIARPPYNWTISELWTAYERLGKATKRKQQNAGVADLISLLRIELGLDEQVLPYRSLVEERLLGWLLRQEQAGVTFDHEQWWWLDRIVDVVSLNAVLEPERLNDVAFGERGGAHGFLEAFGHDRGHTILEELEQELSA